VNYNVMAIPRWVAITLPQAHRDGKTFASQK
jgi:hypothetical protein